jgi:hypothetical protein
MLLVATKVRFIERYRPQQVRWGTIGTILDMEETSRSGFWVGLWLMNASVLERSA